MEGEIGLTLRNEFDLIKFMFEEESENPYSAFNFLAKSLEVMLEWDTGDIITGLKKLA